MKTFQRRTYYLGTLLKEMMSGRAILIIAINATLAVTNRLEIGRLGTDGSQAAVDK